MVSGLDLLDFSRARNWFRKRLSSYGRSIVLSISTPAAGMSLPSEDGVPISRVTDPTIMKSSTFRQALT